MQINIVGIVIMIMIMNIMIIIIIIADSLPCSFIFEPKCKLGK